MEIALQRGHVKLGLQHKNKVALREIGPDPMEGIPCLALYDEGG